jgi:hypothetical protein
MQQSRGDLEAHLAEHIGFITSSAQAYDSGQLGEAKRLAVSLRVLLHNTKSSHSLLEQLGRQSGEFYSTAIPHEPGNISSHGGLVMVALAGKATTFVAMLDDVPYTRWLPFSEWWQEPVFVVVDRRSVLSRRALVLAVANQDGGAHVDPTLDETYGRLSRHNSLGWTVDDGVTSMAIPLAERAAIRQISHEVLKTLLPAFHQKPNHVADMFAGGGMMFNGATVPPHPAPRRVGRNDPCPCGSEVKYKKCHGAPAT